MESAGFRNESWINSLCWRQTRCGWKLQSFITKKENLLQIFKDDVSERVREDICQEEAGVLEMSVFKIISRNIIALKY